MLCAAGKNISERKKRGEKGGGEGGVQEPGLAVVELDAESLPVHHPRCRIAVHLIHMIHDGRRVRSMLHQIGIRNPNQNSDIHLT
jgi:hypothetical protein